MTQEVIKTEDLDPTDVLVSKAHLLIPGSEAIVRRLATSAIVHAQILDKIHSRNYYPAPGSYDTSHQRAVSQTSLHIYTEVLGELASVEQGWSAQITELAKASTES